MNSLFHEKKNHGDFVVLLLLVADVLLNFNFTSAVVVLIVVAVVSVVVVVDTVVVDVVVVDCVVVVVVVDVVVVTVVVVNFLPDVVILILLLFTDKVDKSTSKAGGL